MTPRETIDEYYRTANAGEWSAWCDLFSDDTVMDEQLAGHIEGLATLRDMMKNGLGGYATFQNKPQQYVVDGDQAAVVSHISGTTTKGASIEAGVANYFRFDADGKIAYMANFHDTKPFAPLFDN